MPAKKTAVYPAFLPAEFQGRRATEAVDSIGVYPSLGVCQKYLFRLQCHVLLSPRNACLDKHPKRLNQAPK